MVTKSEGAPEPQPNEQGTAIGSSSPSGHLSEVLANRRALGLSNRIPCLTPYVTALAVIRPGGCKVDRLRVRALGAIVRDR